MVGESWSGQAPLPLPFPSPPNRIKTRCSSLIPKDADAHLVLMSAAKGTVSCKTQAQLQHPDGVLPMLSAQPSCHWVNSLQHFRLRFLLPLAYEICMTGGRTKLSHPPTLLYIIRCFSDKAAATPVLFRPQSTATATLLCIDRSDNQSYHSLHSHSRSIH